MAGYRIVAKRYAEAVFGIARDNGTQDQWSDDLGSIAELVSHPDAARLLESGRVSDEQKRRLVESALRDLSPLALNLARLLLQRNRMAVAPQIAEQYGRLLDAERGIQHAKVTTAVPLDDAGRWAVSERLRELTGAREVKLELDVNPDIIGGMIARVGDTLIDGSTRSRLVQLKRTLAGTAR